MVSKNAKREAESLTLRVPKDLISTWNKYKEVMLKSHPDMREPDGTIKDSTVFRAMLLDYTRHDYYLLSSNIEKIFPILNRIETQVHDVSSSITLLKLKTH